MKLSQFRGPLYVIGALSMGFAAHELVEPRTFASAATCCTYGTGCDTGYVCCLPGSGQADCSRDNPNYCKSGTSCVS